MEKPDPWVGKDMMFLHLAQIVSDLNPDKQVAWPDDDSRCLREAAEILHTALAWPEYVATGKAQLLPPSMEAFRLLSDVGKSVGQLPEASVERARSVLSTINGLLLSQRQTQANLAEAEALFDQVGEYILYSHMEDPLSGCEEPDGDDDD